MKASFDGRATDAAPPAEATAEDVRAHFTRVRALVEAELDRLVPAEGSEPASVHAAVRWSLLAPGKRFRPALLFAAGETFGAPHEKLLRPACAFELVHTYSLVHDDLPAMDDDQLRRGRLTCHVKFDVATAILAGDALQTLAFQTLAEDETLDAPLRVRLVSELARAAGTPDGMVAGQAYDLASENRSDVTGEELERLHRCKTGAMITAAARSGALVAGASTAELDAVTCYASDLGLLFQITDDLLDETGSAEDLGKTPGKDSRARKATYPALYGLEETRERALRAYEQTYAALERLARPAPMLRGIARLVLERRA
jgi:geranylgeranyl pyrophosphate synthase